MDCKEVEHKLIFYIEDELNDKTSKAIDLHLKNCPECNSLYKQLKADLIFLSKDKITGNNPFFYNRLMHNIENENKIKTKNKTEFKQFYIRFLAYAAAIVAAIVLGVALGRDYQPVSNMAEQETLDNDFELFADSYTMDIDEEDAYNMIITDNE